jgi:hypothetical protein
MVGSNWHPGHVCLPSHWQGVGLGAAQPPFDQSLTSVRWSTACLGYEMGDNTLWGVIGPQVEMTARAYECATHSISQRCHRSEVGQNHA